MVSCIGFAACNNGKYLDLTSDERVNLVEDEEGRMINRETGEPVVLYVDLASNDTVYAVTGDVVNGKLSRDDDGVYWYDDGEGKVKIDGDEYKYKNGDVKVKKDFDGDEYKYKDGDVTIKRDRDDYKIERKGYTKKVDEDGDIKIETGDKKIKIDGETGERKVKDQSIFGKVKDKITGQ